MKRFMSLLLRPIVLSVVAFLLLAALIWWIGPLISFGGSHPLDGVGGRLLAIGVLALVFALVVGLKAWRRRRVNKRLVAGLAAGPNMIVRLVVGGS